MYNGVTTKVKEAETVDESPSGGHEPQAAPASPPPPMRTRLRERGAERWRTLRLHYLRLVRMQRRPIFFARGIAVGAFCSFIIPPGIQIILVLVLAPWLRYSALAAAGAVWITNPFTMPFIYPTAFMIGQVLLGQGVRYEMQELESGELWALLLNVNMFGKFALALWTGLFMMGLVCGIVGYFGTRLLMALAARAYGRWKHV